MSTPRTFKVKRDSKVVISDLINISVTTNDLLTFVEAKPIIITDGNIKVSKVFFFCTVPGLPTNMNVGFDPATLEEQP